MTRRLALVCVVLVAGVASTSTASVPSVDRLDAALRANSPDVWTQDLGWPASVNSNCCPVPIPGVAVESVKRITPACTVQCPYTTQYKKKRRNICYHASMKAGTSTTSTYLHRVTDAAVKHLGYTITGYTKGTFGASGGWTVEIDHEKKTLGIQNLWKHRTRYGECESIISIRDPRDQLVSLKHYFKSDVFAPRVKYSQWKTEASIPAVALLRATSPLEHNENSTAGIQLLPFALLKENMFTLLSQVTLFAGFDLTHPNFTNGVMEAEMQGVADDLKRVLDMKKAESEKERYETTTRFRSGKIGGFHDEPGMTPDRIAEIEYFVASLNPLFPQWYPFEYITCDVSGVTGPVWPDESPRCGLKEGVTGLSSSSSPELWNEHLRKCMLHLDLHPWQGAVLPPNLPSTKSA